MELQLIVQIIARYDRELLERLREFAYWVDTESPDEVRAIELLYGLIETELN